MQQEILQRGNDQSSSANRMKCTIDTRIVTYVCRSHTKRIIMNFSVQLDKYLLFRGALNQTIAAVCLFGVFCISVCSYTS